MKLKAAVKYQLWEARHSVFTYYGVILSLIVLFAILNRFSNGSMSAMDGITPIFLFVAGIVTFSIEFKLYMQSGLSRKLLSQSILLTFMIGCLIMLVADLLITMICMIAMPDYISATKQIYPNSTFASRYFFHYCLLFFMSFVGYFVGALYYRMNKVLTIIVSISAPILVMILFGGVGFSINTKIADEPATKYFLDDVITFIGQSPIHLGVFLLLLAAIFAFFSHLLTRRAYIK
jgi:hypothetical protein